MNYLEYFVSETPCKMTPGKKHQILVPETPANKGGGRRKSDGTLKVSESPDLDLVKQAKTPRSMSASLNLHKKTSFYAGENWFHFCRFDLLITFLIQGRSREVWRLLRRRWTRKCCRISATRSRRGRRPRTPLIDLIAVET